MLSIIINLVILIALVVFLQSYRNNDVSYEKKKERKLILSISLSVAIIFFMISFFKSDKSDIIEENEKIYAESAGYVLGSYLAKNHKNEKILVITNKNVRNILHENLLNEFKEATEECNVLAYETPKTNIVTINDRDSLAQEFSAKSFDELINSYPNADIIVSLIGFPPNFQDMELWKKEKIPKFALINCDISIIEEAILNGTVIAAIANFPKRQTFGINKASTKLKDAFNEYYLLITKENLSEVKSKHKNIFQY